MTWCKRGLLLGSLLVIAGGAATLLWLSSLFEEPGAEIIPSLAGRFGMRSVLAVFAHPDDEINAAGLLADATPRPGVVARLITATHGDKGIASPRYPRQELAGIRMAEVRRHGAALGLLEQEIWDYPDGQLVEVPEAQLVGRLVERMRTFRSDVVLTFDPASGHTWHPDHMRIGKAATAAFCAAATADYAPRWLVYVLAPRAIARRFGGERGRLVAALQPAPHFAIPVDPAIKVRGWEIHQSQADYVWRFAHMPPGLLYRLLNKEHYGVHSWEEVCRTAHLN